jgi:hypothetical protein
MPNDEIRKAAKAFIDSMRTMLDPGPADLGLTRINPQGSENEYQVSLLGTPVMEFEDAFLRYFAISAKVDAGEDLLTLSDEGKLALLIEAFPGSTMIELAQAKGVALFKESGIKWERLEPDDEGRIGFSFCNPACPLGGDLRFRLRYWADKWRLSTLTFHAANSPESEAVDFSGDDEYEWLWPAIENDLLLGQV